jgi:hypothetical protein
MRAPLLLVILLLGCTPPPVPAATSDPRESVSPDAAASAEWIRFRSDRTGISLEHPARWTVQETVPDAAGFPHPFQDPIARLRLGPPGTPWGEMEIATYRNPEGWTLQRWEAFYREAEDGEEHPLEDVAPVRLAGVDGLLLVLFEIERTTEQRVLLSGERVFLVRYDRSNPNDAHAEAHQAVHQRVLKSLRLR